MLRNTVRFHLATGRSWDLSWDLSRSHGNSSTNYRGNPPWETMRSSGIPLEPMTHNTATREQAESHETPQKKHIKMHGGGNVVHGKISGLSRVDSSSSRIAV